MDLGIFINCMLDEIWSYRRFCKIRYLWTIYQSFYCQRPNFDHLCPQILSLNKFVTSDEYLLNRQFDWEWVYTGDTWRIYTEGSFLQLRKLNFDSCWWLWEWTFRLSLFLIFLSSCLSLSMIHFPQLRSSNCHSLKHKWFHFINWIFEYFHFLISFHRS